MHNHMAFLQAFEKPKKPASSRNDKAPWSFLTDVDIRPRALGSWEERAA